MGDVSPRTYYDRQLRVPGWGTGGQERLARATVLVVGVGGLGCPALQALARSGVGRLVFCDPDRVEASNLPRQTLFTPADVGRSKVEAAAAALRAANPWVALEGRAERVTAANVRALVEDADLVLDGTDNFATKFLLHDACLAASKPFVLASLYQWEAQVTSFAFHSEASGCWRCLYDEAPEDGCVGVCADVGVAGALAGLAGNAQALAAVRLLLGQPVPHASTLVYEAEGTARTLRWKPRAGCACQQPRSWSFLEAVPTRLEAEWPDVAPDERSIVVDVREAFEIQEDEWAFFEAQGSRIEHYPFSQWAFRQPEWDPEQTYLLVCAKGYRSLAALEDVPSGVRALSLTGGVAHLPVLH